MKFELAQIDVTSNGAKVVRMRKADSWEHPKLIIYRTKDGMICFYWGREVTTVPDEKLSDIYYSAIAYAELMETCDGFTVQELDVSNTRID